MEIVKQHAKNKFTYFLSDIRNEGPVSYNNLVWIKKEIIPQAIKSGIKKIALVFDGDFFSKLYADSIKTALNESGILIDYFKNEIEAVNWIQGNPQ